MRQTILTAALISFLAGGALLGQAVDLQKLSQETMQWDRDQEVIRLVWWIPTEFWRESFKSNPNLAEEQKQAFYKAVDDYVVVVVIEAKLSALGSLTPSPQERIAERLSLAVGQTEKRRPLSESEIRGDARNLFAVMKPVMESMLGQFGQGMVFFCFDGMDAEGNRLLDPGRENFFSIDLGGKTYNWRLPLGSLLPPKYDAETGEEFPGNYVYSPFSGRKLTSAPPPPAKENGNQ